MNKNLKIFLTIILILLVITTITITVLKVLDNKKDIAIDSKYSKEAISVMEAMNLYEDINDKEYSKTVW